MDFFSFKISACISKQILHSIKVAVLYSKHVETRQSIGPKKFITFWKSCDQYLQHTKHKSLFES